MRQYHIETSLWLPQPLPEVFSFFAEARNLERLTPPWLRFEILSPETDAMRAGLRITYRLKLHGIPLVWESEITAWDPPRRFVDTQRRGPYRRWVHEHRFAEQDGGTRVSDHVTYALFGGRLVQRLLVASDLRRIFAYRHEQLREIFRDHGRQTIDEPRTADHGPRETESGTGGEHGDVDANTGLASRGLPGSPAPGRGGREPGDPALG